MSCFVQWRRRHLIELRSYDEEKRAKNRRKSSHFFLKNHFPNEAHVSHDVFFTVVCIYFKGHDVNSSLSAVFQYHGQLQRNHAILSMTHNFRTLFIQHLYIFQISTWHKLRTAGKSQEILKYKVQDKKDWERNNQQKYLNHSKIIKIVRSDSGWSLSSFKRRTGRVYLWWDE